MSPHSGAGRRSRSWSDRRGSLEHARIDDFELVINGSRIEIRYADRLCRTAGADPEPTVAAAEPVTATSAPATPDRGPSEIPAGRGAYLFYFEHKHLTVKGQEIALVMAEELIPQLVGNGVRGMIVSSGRRLLQSELADDVDRLLAFIGEIRHDVGQWGETAYAEGEWERYRHILDQQEIEPKDEPRKPRIDRAKWRSLFYAREERLITARQLHRFAATLGSFAELDPPRATRYFADIIRKNPGEHYASLFSEVTQQVKKQWERIGPLKLIWSLGFTSGLTFDKVTE